MHTTRRRPHLFGAGPASGAGPGLFPDYREPVSGFFSSLGAGEEYTDDELVGEKNNQIDSSISSPFQAARQEEP